MSIIGKQGHSLLQSTIGVRLSVCLLGLLVGFGLGPSHAQTESFDPTVCHSDANGKVTVRLSSGLAFQFPPNNFLVRHYAPSSVEDPTEPYGCPTNPVVVDGIAFPYLYNDLLAQKQGHPSTGNAFRPALLQIFGHSGPVNIQKGDLKNFQRKAGRAKKHECGSIGEILNYCRTGLGLDKNGHLWPTTYAAEPGAYHEYAGLPLAGRCRSANKSNGSRWCEFHYQMEAGLSVMWRVFTHRVPESEFLDLDRSIRSQIQSARRPELDFVESQ